jgi:hypothetical protein
MSDIGTSVEWSDVLETYFKATAERCYGLSWIHKRAEARYAGLRNWTDLPVIVLGVLNSATSVGSGTLFSDPKWASIGVGVVALVTAILSTISSYFKWAARAEAHRISSLQFAKLHRFVSVQLRLPREERMSCADLLKYVRDAFDRLAEISPLVPPEVLYDFNSRFKGDHYKDIAKPSECNGLESVIVFRDRLDSSTSAFKVNEHTQTPGPPTVPPAAHRPPISGRTVQISENTSISASTGL